MPYLSIYQSNDVVVVGDVVQEMSCRTGTPTREGNPTDYCNLEVSKRLGISDYWVSGF